MIEDPIVEEIHQTRHKLMEQCGGDLDRYLDRLQEMEKQHPEKFVPAAPSKDIKARIEHLTAVPSARS